MVALKGKALERLRALDAREAAVKARAEERAADAARGKAGSRERFLSFINSAGPDACHLWAGTTKTNHETRPDIKRYEVGVYTLEGHGEVVAHRLAVMLALDLSSISKDIDIAPTCGDHLCCNLNHLVVREHCGTDRVENSIPVREFFCALAKAEAGHQNLERAADVLLAA